MKKNLENFVMPGNFRNFALKNPDIEMKRFDKFRDACMFFRIGERGYYLWSLAVGHEPEWSDINDDSVTKFDELVSNNYKSGGLVRKNMIILLDNCKLEHKSKGYRNILTHKERYGCLAPYLSHAEREMLADYVTLSKSEMFIRDTFTIMAYTGCNYDVAKRLTVDNISSDGRNIFYENKTGIVTVPADEHAIRAIKNRDNWTVVTTNNGKQKIIKRIALRAGLVNFTKDSTGVMMPMCEAITFYTAMSTFATLLYQQGVEVRDIQQLMGYTSYAGAVKHIYGYKKKRKYEKKNK